MTAATDASKQLTSKYRLAADKAAMIRTNPPRVMSVLEGTAYLGISPRKLRDLIQSRKVPAARLGKRIILRLENLDALTKACET